MAAEQTRDTLTRTASNTNTNGDRKETTIPDEPLYDPRGLQYLEPTQTSLQCSVCCEYFTQPVSVPCGHTFCKGCILQALEVNPGCPLCRTLIDPSLLYEVIALSRLCDELPVYCPHKTLGCNHTCQRIQLGKHLKDDCVYIGTLCRVEECRKKLLKKDLSEHMERPRFDLDAIHIPQCPYEAIRGFLEISKSRMEALEQENQQLRGLFHDMKPQVQQLRDQVGQLSESVQLFSHQEQQMGGGGGGGFGQSMLGYMDMSYPNYHNYPQQQLYRNDSYDEGAGEGGDHEVEMRAALAMERRNNSIGAESMISNGGAGGGVRGSVAETQELLISENERIRSELETLTAGLASLELKQNMAIMTESMRLQEEVQSLRAVCHGLRMQMHYLLLEQQNSRHHPPGPPPPGSPAGGNANMQQAMKGGNNGAGGGGGGGSGGGRPLSTSGPLRPRFSGMLFSFLLCFARNCFVQDYVCKQRY
ncbi:hypothetical protein KI688_001334 [Linnemannia hyalina]|uniref:RING-type domain-containing protein n=1 Tax=Linnemannia hyalina TaxID=64524 RepID=A0A9P8BS27_9FUNG|nr:hypothetical protein KI688_001334 [Linnemannia hyalina]